MHLPYLHTNPKDIQLKLELFFTETILVQKKIRSRDVLKGF